MQRKRKQSVIGTIVVLAIIVISITVVVVKKFTPSKEVMELFEYYQVKDGEIMLVLQNEIWEKKGLNIDGIVYIDYDTVIEKLNDKFYWDANENILLYTKPSEVIRTELGSSDYYVNKSKSSTGYQIVKSQGDAVYIAIDYVKQFSNIEFETYSNPNRIVIDYGWGEDYLCTTVEKATQLRVEPNIKSDILVELKGSDPLTYIETEEVIKNGFGKVITKDGIIGYVKEKNLDESHYETLENDYKEDEYSHISKDYKINMVWHQVTNEAANDNVMTALETTKGVTTVSPTWYSITNNEGEISSLASEKYVERVHNAGAEVWALCDDFSGDVDMFKLLSYTSKREKLTNGLIASAIRYNIDGINIDFENITLEAGIHYVQFIRELSVKCRNNGIVLSVDNYVPTSYSSYYDRETQGEVADYVVIMAYDEHHGGSEASGSVSSLGYVKDAITNTLAEVPGEKIIIAIPFFTRVWKETATEGEVAVSSEAYSMNAALNVLKDNGTDPSWDEESGQYYGEFQSDGVLFKTWLEEDKSIEAKMKVINEAQVAGVASWKLGLEKSSIWDIIIKYIN
jgi:spore germination protein YaaH